MKGLGVWGLEGSIRTMRSRKSVANTSRGLRLSVMIRGHHSTTARRSRVLS